MKRILDLANMQKRKKATCENKKGIAQNLVIYKTLAAAIQSRINKIVAKGFWKTRSNQIFTIK